jgi:ABC-type glycerol-3-phosphate transport system substrate-binding protein
MTGFSRKNTAAGPKPILVPLPPGSRAGVGAVLVLILLVSLAVLSSCSTQLKTPVPATLSQPTATQVLPPSAAVTSTSVTATQTPLVLWLPPQFDPSSGTAAGNLLSKRLSDFSSQNPDVDLQMRIKAASGTANLLDSLDVTHTAAPNALPAVIALPLQDMQVAAQKKLIIPLDGHSKVIDDPDWYKYAQQMALIQGSTYGLPFAGDALVLAYRPAYVGNPPFDWEHIFQTGKPVAFPSGDPSQSLPVALYLSAGGTLVDDQGHPNLQADKLELVLKYLQQGVRLGSLPPWLTDIQNDTQAWQAYREQRAAWLVTWYSRFRSEQPADTAVTVLPGLKGEPVTFTTGWLWCLVDGNPSGQSAGVRLIEFLSDSDFLSTWTMTAGYLPTRPSGAAAIQNQNMKTMISKLVSVANANPNKNGFKAAAPLITDAAVQVIKSMADPAKVAENAVTRLTTP